MLGTSSIVTVTTNTHRAKAASTFTATLFMAFPSFLKVGLIAPASLVSKVSYAHDEANAPPIGTIVGISLARGSELPKKPFSRSSYKHPSTHSGE
jgi:hypothetical protein